MDSFIILVDFLLSISYCKLQCSWSLIFSSYMMKESNWVPTVLYFLNKFIKGLHVLNGRCYLEFKKHISTCLWGTAVLAERLVIIFWRGRDSAIQTICFSLIHWSLVWAGHLQLILEDAPPLYCIQIKIWRSNQIHTYAVHFAMIQPF